jgi:DNA polymerase phi
VAEALDFLALHGLFVVKKKSEKSAFAFVRSPAKPAFIEELRAACCTKLLSSLADLTGSTVVTKTKDGKSTKATGVAADGTLWVSVVLESLEKFESDPKHIKPVAELDEVEGALRAKAKAALANLKTVRLPSSVLGHGADYPIQVSDNHKSEAHGAELLLGASLLQRYCAVDEGEADESLQVRHHLPRMNICTQPLQAATDATSRMFSAKVTKKSKKVRQAVEIDPDVDTLPPLDVLIDVIIGFLDESTAYMRTVANQAFAQLGGVIERRETLGLILTVRISCSFYASRDSQMPLAIGAEGPGRRGGRASRHGCRRG